MEACGARGPALWGGRRRFVTGLGRARRLPRSYQSGRLLSLLAHEFPGHDLERLGEGRAHFIPRGEGQVIEVRERVDRRFLGHTEIAQFLHTVDVEPGEPARLRVGHSGRLKRQGVEVVVVAGDGDVERLATRISNDEAFTGPGLALDFTKFEMERSPRQWTVTVELMGASFVSLALPPMRSYVRLHEDQREALLAALKALGDHLARS